MSAALPSGLLLAARSRWNVPSDKPPCQNEKALPVIMHSGMPTQCEPSLRAQVDGSNVVSFDRKNICLQRRSYRWKRCVNAPASALLELNCDTITASFKSAPDNSIQFRCGGLAGKLARLEQ